MDCAGAWVVGARVEARYLASSRGPSVAKHWYAGVVRAVHADGSVDVHYDDGDKEDHVKPKFVRALDRPPAADDSEGGEESEASEEQL